jgi:hypothetical protein
LGRRVQTVKKSREALVVASKENGQEGNAGNMKYMVMSQDEKAG